MTRTLLVDADMLVYKIAGSIERPIDWGDDLWTLHSDFTEGIEALENHLAGLMETLEADALVLALTDQTSTFRLDFLPTYKGNRKSVRRPLCWAAMRNYMMTGPHKAYLRPNLEGDDVLGILSTHPTLIPGEKIIVSGDKDFFTIPGKFYRETGLVEDRKIVTVTEAMADRWHMIQTLAGDTTDGYTGCPGVGMGRAEDMIDNPVILEAYDYTITRGARKGESEVRFNETPTSDLWASVVSRYEAAGQSDLDALIQARCARILRAGDYDFANKKPILWNPPA